MAGLFGCIALFVLAPFILYLRESAAISSHDKHRIVPAKSSFGNYLRAKHGLLPAKVFIVVVC